MSLNSSGLALAGFIASNFAEFSADNCKWVDDDVFEYVQVTDETLDSCIIVELIDAQDYRAREFSSLSVVWQLSVNYFHKINVDDDYVDSYLAGVAFIDDLYQLLATNSRLDGSVIAAKPVSVGQPIVYRRAIHNYIMFDIAVNILENIS